MTGPIAPSSLHIPQTAAPGHVLALNNDMKAQVRRRLFGARPWPERMVATAPSR